MSAGMPKDAKVTSVYLDQCNGKTSRIAFGIRFNQFEGSASCLSRFRRVSKQLTISNQLGE